MNLQQIQYVLTVAKKGNFSKAAKELYISQPSLSEAIKKLEQEIGITLFYRSRNGAKLTSVGKEFVMEGERLLSQFSSFNHRIKNYCVLLKGQVNLGLFWSFGYTKIPQQLNLFMSDYPDVKVRYIINGSRELQRKIRNKEIDIAFVTGFEGSFDSKLVAHLVSSSPLVALVNTHHPLASKNQLHFKDLSGHNILNLAQGSNMYQAFNHHLKQFATNYNVIGESSQMDAAFQIATNNFGISFVSKEVTHAFNYNNVKVLDLMPSLIRNIYLIYHEENSDHPVINELLKVFKQD